MPKIDLFQVREGLPNSLNNIIQTVLSIANNFKRKIEISKIDFDNLAGVVDMTVDQITKNFKAIATQKKVYTCYLN